MERIKAELKFDMYYILDNDFGGEKYIGRETEFIKYVNFLLSQEKKELIKNRDEALDKFSELNGNKEPGEGLEIIIRYEVY